MIFYKPSTVTNMVRFGRVVLVDLYFFVVNSSLFATKSSGIVEEPRAVFLHLFRVGHFLSFSAFSGWLLELFTVTFRRVQRFYARGDHGRNRNNHLWVQNKARFLLSVTVRLLPFNDRIVKLYSGTALFSRCYC